MKLYRHKDNQLFSFHISESARVENSFQFLPWSWGRKNGAKRHFCQFDGKL